MLLWACARHMQLKNEPGTLRLHSQNEGLFLYLSPLCTPAPTHFILQGPLPLVTLAGEMGVAHRATSPAQVPDWGPSLGQHREGRETWTIRDFLPHTLEFSLYRNWELLSKFQPLLPCGSAAKNRKEFSQCRSLLSVFACLQNLSVIVHTSECSGNCFLVFCPGVLVAVSQRVRLQWAYFIPTWTRSLLM